MDFTSDIPADIARAAHRGTSFDPDRRGTQEIEGYAATMAADYATLKSLATNDAKRATLDEEFPRYRAKYRALTIAYLGAHSRCMSSMITGPSNFPSARNAKRNASADARMTGLVEYRARALAKIKRKLQPELQPIMAGDDDATTRLRDKLAKLEAVQVSMKAANAAIRKHAKAGAAAQIAALVALGFHEGQARDLIEPDFCGRIGFADYQTKNNGAEIRRLRARLAAVTVAKETPDEVTSSESGIRVEESASDNRIRIFYPGKPSAEVRTRLKRNGFRWTPSLGCWQAYRNHTSLSFVASGILTYTPEVES